MQILFGDDIRTAGERMLLNLCKISIVFCLGVPVLLRAPIGHFPNWLQTTVIGFLILNVFIFLASFCILGVKAAGRSHGKRTLLEQTMFTLSRVGLYLFLPCAIITALLVLVMWSIGTL